MARPSTMFLALPVLLCLVPACLESNPQPSPGGGGEWNSPGEDVADRAALDTSAGDGIGGGGGGDALADVVAPSDATTAETLEDGVAADALEDGVFGDVGGDLLAPDGAGCGGDGEICVFEGAPELLCFPESQTCYDPDGTCDGVASKCRPGTASACVDLLGNPGLPGGSVLQLCSCEDPAPLGEVLECLPQASCPPSDDCFPGQACTEVDLMCMFMDGCPDPAYGGGICVGSGLLDGLSLP